MAEIIDFPIPKDPELAEFAYAVKGFIEAQVMLNEAVSKAFIGFSQLSDVQMQRIENLEKALEGRG